MGRNPQPSAAPFAPALLFAAVSLRRCRGSVSSSSFPAAILVPGSCCLPSMGSVGFVPPLRRYYAELRLLVACPALLPLRFLHGPVSSWFVFRSRQSRTRLPSLDLFSGVPTRVSTKTTRPPKFLGTPLCVRRALRPRRDLDPSHKRGVDAATAVINQRRSRECLLSRLDRTPAHSLCTLRSQRHRRPRNTRYRLVATPLPDGLGPLGRKAVFQLIDGPPDCPSFLAH